ncbi:hypothetical protein M9Y10_019779 [Tritrichomonas musculus]|uniref:Sel1 repeat family protein n=1 Tax=Tritrichomonas musculus TaxID=1915356 RepID=A0ABR2HHD8_9EUKA
MNFYTSMLYNGDYVKINKEESLHYYKMAADKGNVSAMLNYASMIEHEEVDSNADKTDAIIYFKMAAGRQKRLRRYIYLVAYELFERLSGGLRTF